MQRVEIIERVAPVEAELREAWEAGFRLCRSYGDNCAHFDGEQKERQWQAYLAERVAPVEADAIRDALDEALSNFENHLDGTLTLTLELEQYQRLNALVKERSRTNG